MSAALSPRASFLRSRYTWSVVLLASLSIPLFYRSANFSPNSIWPSATRYFSSFSPSSSPSLNSNPTSSQSPIQSAISNMSEAKTSRMPVYFLGIGGPNFMEQTNHPAFHKLGETGKEITQKVKPKAIVVFSAHWQEGPSYVKINVADEMDIIYDFYGFPPSFYEHKFPNKGSPELAEKVISLLNKANIDVGRTRRGLDHGVWVGFLAAFDPKKNPLNVPIVQVSLFGNEDWDAHFRMGRALESLRDEGVLIIGAGMAVHNLHDFRRYRMQPPQMPYSTSFEEALGEAISSDPANRRAAMTQLMRRKDAKQAHPSMEHILPIHVAAGAAGLDVGERIWALPEGSLNWGQYRFGDIPSA